MESEKNNKIDLAKWLSGELTPEEKLAFEKSEDYKAYAKIVNAMEKLKDPAYDEDEVLSKIKEKIASQSKVKTLNIRYLYGAAASLVLLFGLYFFTKNATESFQTDFGQQIALILPDGSEVTLNSKSTVFYDKNSWNSNRMIRLDGEAYFNVTKGSPFKVVTKEGIVEVLGTQFNIDTNENYFEIKCYSGKVKVTNNQQVKRILTKGNANRTYNDTSTDWNFDPAKTFWIAGESTFKETPFLQVIDALEDQYQINIENSELFKNERFTGYFLNNNLDLALKTVFEAMNIEYEQKDTNVKLSKK